MNITNLMNIFGRELHDCKQCFSQQWHKVLNIVRSTVNVQWCPHDVHWGFSCKRII